MRRFTIADGMILVATTALALVAARSKIVDPGMPQTTVAWAIPNLAWMGLSFTLALIAIRLVGPRPGRDDLWRQPGFVACLSVAIALTVSVFNRLLSIATVALKLPQVPIRGELVQLFQDSIYLLPYNSTTGITATWAVLALGGRWKAGPGWIDRAGRAIGVYWIALKLLECCSLLFN